MSKNLVSLKQSEGPGAEVDNNVIAGEHNCPIGYLPVGDQSGGRPVHWWVIAPDNVPPSQCIVLTDRPVNPVIFSQIN